jgi:hypothetical protein
LVLKRIANKRTVQNALTSHSWVSHIQGRHEHGSKIKIAYSLGHHQGGGLAAWSSQHPYLPPSNDQYLARSAYMNFFQGMHSFQTYVRIWRYWAPSKCKLFLWLVAHES